MMPNLFADIRYAVRQLRRSPGFTAVALLTLALGIGANTGMFTLVNAVLLKSLPVPHPDQLFLVRARDRFAEQTRVSYPLYKRMSDAMPDTVNLAAMTRPGDLYLKSAEGQPEVVWGQLVSGNYFQTFETYSVMGRLLGPADDRKIDGHPVAVVSYACWKNRFGSDANIIGREVLINGSRFSIVGVAAPQFFGAEPGRAPDLWLPLIMQSSLHYAQHYSKSTAADAAKPWVLQRDISWLSMIVRVPDTRRLAELSGVLNRLAIEDMEKPSDDSPQARLDRELVLEPGGQGIKLLQREFEKPLVVLSAMVAMVLLIACANLAGLLLARGAARSREVAVRFSMGASRRRLVRQLLTESLLLSGVGGLLGLAVAYGCDIVLPQWASSSDVAIPLNLAPDSRVLIFSIAIVLATATLFGLAPALQATAIEPVAALKSNSSRVAGGERSRWSLRHALIVTQFVFSLVLLVGAGLFLRTMQNLVHLNPGFDRDHILTVWLETNVRHYSHDQLLSFYHDVLDRTRALPGVRSASLATCGLSSNCRSASDIYLPGQAQLAATTQTNIVSLQYFDNVGIPLVRGRDFSAADGENSPHVAIVNQSLARKLFGTSDPVGQRFGFDADKADEFQIVGVVADAYVNSVQERVPPMIYFPLLQVPTDVESLDIRSVSDPAALTGQVRQLLLSVDPDLPIGHIGTLSDQISSTLGQQRLIARLTSIFGGLALGLACLGLYGLMSYMVARRTGELGVRLALGSSRSALLWLVMRQSIVLAGTGIAGGVLLSFLALRGVSSLLFGLSPYDPVTMLVAAALLFAVAVASGIKPAWRAARVDPMVALRYE